MTPLKVGVIGYGYWGPNQVRTYIELPDAEVLAVADRSLERLEQVRIKHQHVPYFLSDHRQMFELDLDAVVVCTPPETHHDIVVDCLEHGLNVLVEKPLTTNTADALHLAEVAESMNRTLMVGHIGAYNPAVNALKQMIEAGELGDIRYIDAVRVGLGLFHPRLNVIWDLAPHDISILLHLLGEQPVSVSTRGLASVQESVEDVAYMTLSFPSGIFAHSRMSWLDPRKTRRITVVGKEKMVIYDDLESHEKLKIYDKTVSAVRQTDTFGDYQFAYHYGNVVSPYIHFEEPLRLEARHFVECIVEGKRPITDAYNGVSVVRVIEAVQKSLKQGGVQIPVEDGADIHLPETELTRFIPPIDVRRPPVATRRAGSSNDHTVPPTPISPPGVVSTNGNGHKQNGGRPEKGPLVLDLRDGLGNGNGGAPEV